MPVGTTLSVRVVHPRLRIRVPLARATVKPLVCWVPSAKSRLIGWLLHRHSGTFVDVGANIGQTLLDYLYSGSRPGYWGFEPNPECIAILQEVIARNNLVDCSVLNVGLSDDERNTQLYVSPTFPTDTRATLSPDVRPSRAYRATQVQVVPFDRLRDRLGIAEIGLIKIDVEGAELSVLRGMRKTLAVDRPPVLCEVLLRDAAADPTRYRSGMTALMRLLSDLDYVVIPLRNGIRGPRLSDPLTAFPTKVWTHLRRRQCDYLLLPAEDADHTRVGVQQHHMAALRALCRSHEDLRVGRTDWPVTRWSTA